MNRVLRAFLVLLLSFLSPLASLAENDKTRSQGVAGKPSAKNPGTAESSANAKFEAQINRGIQLRKRRMYDQSVAQFDRVLAMSPPPKSAALCTFEKGQVLYLQGVDQFNSRAVGDPLSTSTLQRSLAAFHKVVADYPEQPTAASATYMAASTRIRLNDPESALAGYREAYTKYPHYENRSRALLRIGITLMGIERMNEARSTFQRVWTEFPDKKNDARKARNYVGQLAVVGKKFTPLRADSWMFGTVDAGGMNSFDGEVRALVFVATWCTSCSKALPGLRKVVEMWSQKGMLFFGVINPSDPKSAIRPARYIDKAKLDFIDVALVSKVDVWKAYRGQSLPAVALIDRRGMVRWRGHPSFFPSTMAQKLLDE